MTKKKPLTEMTDQEQAMKLMVECVYWPTSLLVAHVAWTASPRMGVVIYPQLDLAVAQELDRRLPAPEEPDKESNEGIDAARQRVKPLVEKIHLREGACKRGARGIQEAHCRFVESDINACLTCARICGCEECDVLRRDFGKRVLR